MSNALHPGIILILVGLIAAIVPKALRRVVLAIGPFAALAAALTMPMGTDLSMEFFGTGYVLDYFHVDGLSYVFCMIFALMACIGGSTPATMTAASKPSPPWPTPDVRLASLLPRTG